jgi:hypothetical protein
MEEACASERKQPFSTLDLALQSCFGARCLDVVLILLLAGVRSTTFSCLQLGCDVTLGILHSRADCGPFVVAVRTKGATLAIHFACCGLVQSSQTSNAFNRGGITREMAWYASITSESTRVFTVFPWLTLGASTGTTRGEFSRLTFHEFGSACLGVIVESEV